MNTLLQLSLPVASHIFRCAGEAAPGQLLGVVQLSGGHSVFLPVTTADISTDSEAALPVYLHRPAGGIRGPYLLVETGTRGVLEIRAYVQQGDRTGTIPIIT